MNEQPIDEFASIEDKLQLSSGKSIKPGGVGSIPVFGSNGRIGYCDEPLFDEGVVIGRVGAYCGSVMISQGPFWASDNTIVALPLDESETSLRYVYYALNHAGLNQYAGGAAQPLLTQRDLKPVRVRFPKIDEQRHIAAVLTAYDELIENNTRRIKILEEMAQSIYKEWFVNFRYPGHESVPLVNSPLGSIPNDWTVAPMQDLIEFNIGGGWGKESPDESHSDVGVVIRGTDIPRARHMDVSVCPTRFHAASNLRNRILRPGDLVMEVSGGSTDQPVGRTMLVTSRLLDELGETAICASFCKLIRADSDVAPEWLYFLLINFYNSGQVEEYQVQSTGIRNLQFKQFLQMGIAIPPSGIATEFGELSKAMLSEIAVLGITNRNLRATRDLLLPRLISGDIDVSALEIPA